MACSAVLIPTIRSSTATKGTEHVRSHARAPAALHRPGRYRRAPQGRGPHHLGPRHGRRQGGDRARHQGRSAARQRPGRWRAGRAAGSVLRRLQQAQGLHHRGHRRSWPRDGDGLPAQPAGVGGAGRAPRLLQRGRAAPDQRRRAGGQAAGAGLPRPQDLSRQGQRSRRPRRARPPAHRRDPRRRHGHRAGRGRGAARRQQAPVAGLHAVRGQVAPDPPHARGAGRVGHQAAARGVRQPVVPWPARRRRPRAVARRAQRAARDRRPRPQGRRPRSLERDARGHRQRAAPAGPGPGRARRCRGHHPGAERRRRRW